MQWNTLTDLYVERGLIDPPCKRLILDGDEDPMCVSNEEESSQNEEKSQA